MQDNSNDNTNEELRTFLCRYIEVCNDVMEANEARFPFAQVWRALEAELAGRPIEYSVKKDKQRADVSAIFIDGKIRLIKQPDNKRNPAIPKPIDWHYLNAVLEKPARFIANPSLVDWYVAVNEKASFLRH